MKKYIIFIYVVLLFSLLLILTGCSNNNENNKDSSGTRTSTTIVSKNDEKEFDTSYIPKEEEISSYSTTIIDNSAGRLTNISITCSILNNTIIENGKTFSFNETIGKPTPERGYQEAKVIIDHKAELGIGGGNCQVSSTLYNSAIAIPNIAIIERHEHGKDVGYVPKGKDAAISYGSLDLKLRNDTGNNIKIVALTDNKTITIKLLKLT